MSKIADLLLSRNYKGSIGVVSPFRAQVNLIVQLLNESNQLSTFLNKAEIMVETVHKFQGDERDVMFFSPVVGKGMRENSLQFLQDNGNLFNVAITRARSALIVVGDQNAARHCNVDYLSSFAAYTLNIKQMRQQNQEIAQRIELGPRIPCSFQSRSSF